MVSGKGFLRGRRDRQGVGTGPRRGEAAYVISCSDGYHADNAPHSKAGLVIGIFVVAFTATALAVLTRTGAGGTHALMFAGLFAYMPCSVIDTAGTTASV